MSINKHEQFEYKCESDESLENLAEKFLVHPQMLKIFNDLSQENVHKNQIVKIPINDKNRKNKEFEKQQKNIDTKEPRKLSLWKEGDSSFVDENEESNAKNHAEFNNMRHYLSEVTSLKHMHFRKSALNKSSLKSSSLSSSLKQKSMGIGDLQLNHDELNGELFKVEDDDITHSNFPLEHKHASVMPQVFKSKRSLRHQVLHNQCGDKCKNHPVKIQTSIDVSFLKSLRNKIKYCQVLMEFKVVMNHALGDLPGMLQLYHDKLLFKPDKYEVKKLNHILIKAFQNKHSTSRKIKDIRAQRRLLKKGLWERELQWEDICSFDILQMAPNNIMEMQIFNHTYISDPNDLNLIFEMRKYEELPPSPRSESNQKLVRSRKWSYHQSMAEEVHNKLRKVDQETITKPKTILKRSNSQRLNKTNNNDSRKETMCFRLLRENCSEASKQMRWKADTQIVLDRMLMIDKAINQYRNGAKNQNKQSEKLKHLNAPRIEGSSQIIHENWSFLINMQLQSLLRKQKWNLVFSSDIHGRTLNSLFLRMKRLSREYPSILMIKTQCNKVFGLFLDENLKNRQDYYGSGKTFIFQLVQEKMNEETGRTLAGCDSIKDLNEIVVQRASNENNQYVSQQKESILIGGGSNIALRIHDGMRIADSYACETFRMSNGLFETPRVNIQHLEVFSLSNTQIKLDDNFLM